jgi:hypothetical protein
MSALDELRESLREAARVDVEAARRRRRRRRRRTGGVLAVILVGGAAAAGATDLISVGEPAKPPAKDLPAHYQQSGRVQLLQTAPSGTKEPYGLGTYTAKNGQRCFLIGQVRGAQLGLVERGTFRPYPEDRSGPCQVSGKSVHGSIVAGPNTVIGGLAAPGVRLVRVTGIDRPIKPGKDGAWLIVVDERIPPNGIFVNYE